MLMPGAEMMPIGSSFQTVAPATEKCGRLSGSAGDGAGTRNDQLET
jgi:hypothetical protein